MILQTLNLNGFGSKHGRPLDLIIWLSMHLILWSNLSLWLAHITKLLGPKFEIWIPHWKSMTINVHTAQYTLKKRDPLSLPSTSTVFFPHPIFSLSYSPHPTFELIPYMSCLCSTSLLYASLNHYNLFCWYIWFSFGYFNCIS
jgi:hypothetical protein